MNALRTALVLAAVVLGAGVLILGALLVRVRHVDEGSLDPNGESFRQIRGLE